MKQSIRISFLLSFLLIQALTFSLAASESVAKRTLPSSAAGKVSIKITPQSSVRAYAIEEILPSGCKATDINNDGWTDKEGKIVKWGIFYDQKTRELSYQVTCPETSQGKLLFIGTASFDGHSIEVGGDNTLKIPSKLPSKK